MDDSEKTILDLEELAATILKLKERNTIRQRRPLFIEFCGTPKAGKTSTINALNIFLKRNHFKTVLLTERASICPIENKQKPFFNVWTSCSTLAEIVKNLSNAFQYKNIDIILADRGLFDSLCWFNWSKNRNSLNTDDYIKITSFLFMPLFSRYIDLIFIFHVTPEVSIQREYAHLLTRKEGSIMNREVLEEYNISVQEVQKEFRPKNQKIENISTDQDDQNYVNYKVTKKVLENLREILIEQIGFFNSKIIQNLKTGLETHRSYENLFGPFVLLKDETQSPYYTEKPFNLEFGLRDEVEESVNIQPVPIAVITNSTMTKLLIVQKCYQGMSIDSPERDKTLIYIGGHIRKEDYMYWNFYNVAKITLERELEEELGLSMKLDNYLNDPYFIYDDSNSRSKRHLAICFILKLEINKLDIIPDSRELLIEKNSKSCSFIELDELKEQIEKGNLIVEYWSSQILQKIFKIEEIKSAPNYDLFNQSFYNT